MYDTAKRSMVFAVATGGLLFAGAAQASADTAATSATPGGGSNATQATTPLDTLESADDAAPVVGSGGLLSNNNVEVPLALSLNLCGNSISVLGTAASGANCSSSGMGSAATVASATPSRGGLLSSNSVLAPINIPVNACGNAVSVVGHADTTSGSTCTVTSGSSSTASSGAATGTGTAEASALPVGRILHGVLSSNTVMLPVDAPVNACGNGVAIVGHSTAAASCSIDASAAASSASAPQTALMPQTAPQVSEAQQPQAMAAPAAVVFPGDPIAVGQPIAAKIPPNRPLTAHPVVMWPRPELAAMTIPAAHAADPVLAADVSQDPPAMSLAQTGAETVLPLGAAAAALVGGFSLRAAGQHRRRNRG